MTTTDVKVTKIMKYLNPCFICKQFHAIDEECGTFSSYQERGADK